MDSTVRPFRVTVADEDVADLRRRIAATRWPEKETVDDASSGVPLATVQALADYWGSEYDFGRVEKRLNAVPQFMTDIDGLGIHFLHARSPHENALPLIITHGWPGSVVEMLNVIGPLSDPTQDGGDPADVSKALGTGGPAPSGLSAEETRAFEQLSFLYTKGIGYATEMNLRPQTLYGLADCPVFLAAWMLDHDARSLEDIAAAFDGHAVGNLTRDEILDNVTMTWLTNTGVSSARLYYEKTLGFFDVSRASPSPPPSRSSRTSCTRRRQLGRAGVPEPHLLQRGRPGQPLRRLAEAAAVHYRGAGRVPVAATNLRSVDFRDPGGQDEPVPAAGILDEDDALELLAYLVTAARTQVDEAAEYGPMRLLTAARRLADVMAPGASAQTRALVTGPLQRMPLLAVPRADGSASARAEYVATLDEMCRAVAELLTARYAADLPPA